ncbi:MAG: short-chain dehydrogenase/reductase [Bryobacterales bacterium]|nr:short-chain dehydrogenase/reductase [Bryobacterales bacterium]
MHNGELRSVIGKCVLITGAGRGIGKRLAIGLAKAGARIGLVARTVGELDATKLEIEHAHGQAFRVCADVGDYAQMADAARRISLEYNGIDLLIAAAATQGPIGPFAEANPGQFEETIRTNLLGVMNALHAVLPRMIERRSGKAIVMAGGGAASSRPNFSSYAASKAALVRFVESVADEVRDHNVQINCLSPGGSYTSMTDEILEAGERAGAAEIEDARQVRLTGGVTAEKQIAFALFLASDRSNHISGKIIHVHDDLKRLEHMNMTPDLYTLRRLKS